MSNDKILKEITNVSFLALGLFPLLKESIGSILIITCSILFFLNSLVFKLKLLFNKDVLYLTTIFWMFLTYELLSLDFTVKQISLHLPFLIFPILFFYKPPYIGDQAKHKALIVFQLSIFVASIYFVFIFLKANHLNTLFEISNENIPFFRDYIFRHSKLNVHPTYFATFLLASFTLSGYSLFFEKNDRVSFGIRLFNIIFVSIMLFLFSSRIVICAYFITVLALISFFFKRIDMKKRLISLLIVFSIIILSIVPFYKILSQRFSEVFTEYSKPIEGNRHNSINIRMAILECSYYLNKESPFWGYGNDLQKKLNDCYDDRFDSNFNQNTTFNTHNYYFNLILYGGWCFFMIFVLYIFFLLFKLKNYPLAIIFIIQFLIINFTENFLSRHYGIIMFNYFISLFFFFNVKRLPYPVIRK